MCDMGAYANRNTIPRLRSSYHGAMTIMVRGVVLHASTHSFCNNCMGSIARGTQRDMGAVPCECVNALHCGSRIIGRGLASCSV